MTRALPLLLALATLPALAGAAPPIPPPPKWRAPTATAATTASGVRVAVLAQRELPLVHVRVVVRAGADLDPPAQPGLASAVATMLQDGGAGSRSAPEVAAAIEALGAELRVECDRNATQLSVTVLSRNLDRALALLGDLVARPRFDADEWARTRSRRLAEIARQRDEPALIADALFDQLVFGDHPYARRLLGTPTSVEKMALPDLRAFYAAHYGPRTTSVVLVGDVTATDGAKRVEAALAGWEGKAEPGPAPPAPAPPPPRLVLVDRPGAPQSELRVGHLGIARASADYAGATVLSTVLGGSFTSRLIQNLREKHGYTYGASSRFLAHRAAGPLVIRTAVRTDVTGPSLREVLAELEGIRKPLSAEEAGKGRALVESGLVDRFGDRTRAGQIIAELLVNDLPLDTWSRLSDDLAPLDGAALAPLAARLFHPDALTIVVVGDRKAVEGALRGFKPAVEYRDADGNLVK